MPPSRELVKTILVVVVLTVTLSATAGASGVPAMAALAVGDQVGHDSPAAPAAAAQQQTPTTTDAPSPMTETVTDTRPDNRTTTETPGPGGPETTGAAETTDPLETDTLTTESDGQPGFAVITTALALLGAGWLAHRRRD